MVKGECPVCGRTVTVRRDGRLRDHQGRSMKLTTASGRTAYAWCPGSDTHPVRAHVSHAAALAGPGAGPGPPEPEPRTGGLR
jgi:hypothetical protein